MSLKDKCYDTKAFVLEFSHDSFKEAVLTFGKYLKEHDERCPVTTRLYSEFQKVFGEWEE